MSGRFITSAVFTVSAGSSSHPGDPGRVREKSVFFPVNRKFSVGLTAYLGKWYDALYEVEENGMHNRRGTSWRESL